MRHHEWHLSFPELLVLRAALHHYQHTLSYEDAAVGEPAAQEAGRILREQAGWLLDNVNMMLQYDVQQLVRSQEEADVDLPF